MSETPSAPALGAQDAPWLARLRRLANMPMLADASRISVGLVDLQAAVEAVDAQAARLAAHEATIRQLGGDLTCADAHSRYVGRNMGSALITNQDLQADRDRLAARLAAVEAERDHLHGMLQTHARHRACCAEHLTSGRLGCDCGLTEALEGPGAEDAGSVIDG